MCTPAAALLPAGAATAAVGRGILARFAPMVATPPGAPVGGPPSVAQAVATPQQSRTPAAMAGRAGMAMRDPTLLAGPGGVAPNLLTIGRNSLLGS